MTASVAAVAIQSGPLTARSLADPAANAANASRTTAGALAAGTVPDGTCAAKITALGGTGGSSPVSGGSGGRGGAGAAISATFAVVPGQSFSGTVGGGGQLHLRRHRRRGWWRRCLGGTVVVSHRGAGGGGRTTVVLGGSVVVVAGGGGGGGAAHQAGPAGFGAAAGFAGIAAGSVAVGSNGSDGVDTGGTTTGGGGGQSAAGGVGGVTSQSAPEDGSPGDGTTTGNGGNGGPDPANDSGGGGGGGYTGGGGGGSTFNNTSRPGWPSLSPHSTRPSCASIWAVSTRGVFLRELYRRDQRVGSAYDGTATAADPFPAASRSYAPDPTLDSLRPAFTTAMHDEYERLLGWTPEGHYELLSADVIRQWQWGNSTDSPTSFTELRLALAADPAFRVIVMHGLYDLVTPYLASQAILDQVPDLGAPDRIALRVHPGGHMFYTNDASRALLHEDGAWLLQK